LFFSTTDKSQTTTTFSNSHRVSELNRKRLEFCTAGLAEITHPDWAPFAPGLKTIDDARALRERLLSACELAERNESDEVRQRRLTTVIIGGGATGLEMAGPVAELLRRPAHPNSTTYGSNCCSSV